jgi:hypothetical protein
MQGPKPLQLTEKRNSVVVLMGLSTLEEEKNNKYPEEIV